MQGLWFSMDGLSGEEIVKEMGLKGIFGLLWLNGFPSHGFRFAVTLLILLVVIATMAEDAMFSSEHAKKLQPFQQILRCDSNKLPETNIVFQSHFHGDVLFKDEGV
ncbi:hypothetical protein NC651_009813 [Populus alba x Populus x berolinensis]|nr:hypothetical protein NC651_009813 [Populus alba x Populus x berolinensis]